VVCTATDYQNFFALRRHKDAQPEMKALADAMWDAREASIPKLLQPGEWHLPYVTPDEIKSSGPGLDNPGGKLSMMDWKRFIKLSVARCARVSYLTHDGKQPNIDEDLKLYDRLVGSVPLHASPAEHQATPDQRNSYGNEIGPWWHKEQWGNFRGYRQYRHMLPNESTPG
jgi:thymidylate synthase ThyX